MLELIEVRNSQSGQQIPDAYVLIIEKRHSVWTDVTADDRHEKKSFRVHVLPFSQVSKFKTQTGNSIGFVWSYKLYGAQFEGFAFAKGYFPAQLIQSSRRYFIDKTQISKEQFETAIEHTPRIAKNQFIATITGKHNISTSKKIDDHYYIILCEFPAEIYLEPMAEEDATVTDHLIYLVSKTIDSQQWTEVKDNVRKKVERVLNK